MAENERIPNELSLEYSKANAGCKKCGRTIKDGDLRAVKLVRSHFHEGYDARYFHYECGLPFADTLSDWNGLGKLAWRDVLKVASEYGVENPGLQKQHEARLALSQQLQTYPKDELARILKHNGLFQCVKRGSHGWGTSSASGRWARASAPSPSASPRSSTTSPSGTSRSGTRTWRRSFAGSAAWSSRGPCLSRSRRRWAGSAASPTKRAPGTAAASPRPAGR